jgi:hypothetical protein
MTERIEDETVVREFLHQRGNVSYIFRPARDPFHLSFVFGYARARIP